MRILAAACVGLVLGLVVAWFGRAPAESGPPVVAPSVVAGRAGGAAPGAAPAAAARVAPSKAGEAPVQRDPKARDYDAGRLYRSSWTDAATLYANEPRDEAWAGGRERSMHDLVDAAYRSVDPDAEIEIECHTSTCRVKLTSSSRFLIDELPPYPLACLGRITEPSFDDGFVESTVIFDGDSREAGAFATWHTRECAKWRDEWLERRDRFLRTGSAD